MGRFAAASAATHRRVQITGLSAAVMHRRREAASARQSVDGDAVHGDLPANRHARLEVTGEGGNLAWLLALWESGRESLGVHPR